MKVQTTYCDFCEKPLEDCNGRLLANIHHTDGRDFCPTCDEIYNHARIISYNKLLGAVGFAVMRAHDLLMLINGTNEKFWGSAGEEMKKAYMEALKNILENPNHEKALNLIREGLELLGEKSAEKP